MGRLRVDGQFDGVVVTASDQSQGYAQYRDNCPRHDSHEPFEAQGFTVEKNGIIYRLLDEYSLSYCPACLEWLADRYEQYANLDGVEEFLATQVTSQWFRSGDADSLQSAFHAVGHALGDVEACLYCGGDVTVSELTKHGTTEVDCPDCGTYEVTVELQ